MKTQTHVWAIPAMLGLGTQDISVPLHQPRPPYHTEYLLQQGLVPDSLLLFYIFLYFLLDKKFA